MASELVWDLRTADRREVRGASVKLTPSDRVLGYESRPSITVLPAPVYVPLEVREDQDGGAYLHLEVQVPATDDPAFTPQGWAWRVELVNVPAAPRPFYCLAPEGEQVDLGQVVPVEDVDGTLVTRGADGRGIDSIRTEGTTLRIVLTDGTELTVPAPAPAVQAVEVAPGVYRLGGQSG